MRRIPPPLKKEMASDPFYQVCVLLDGDCGGKIEWHHNLIFAGKQVNEKFCILPVCQNHHRLADHTIIRERLNHVMWNRATPLQIKQYSKSVNYSQILKFLNEKYS